MTSAPEIAFIVGASLSSIITDIRLDRGWKRLGLGLWEDDEGRKVNYLADPERLRGVPIGTRVYFAPGYEKHHAWHRISEGIENRACFRADL